MVGLETLLLGSLVPRSNNPVPALLLQTGSSPEGLRFAGLRA